MTTQTTETTDDVQEWMDRVDSCAGDCEECPEFGLCDENLDAVES